jgi:hypothetical protein
MSESSNIATPVKSEEAAVKSTLTDDKKDLAAARKDEFEQAIDDFNAWLRKAGSDAETATAALERAQPRELDPQADQSSTEKALREEIERQQTEIATAVMHLANIDPANAQCSSLTEWLSKKNRQFRKDDHISISFKESETGRITLNVTDFDASEELERLVQFISTDDMREEANVEKYLRRLDNHRNRAVGQIEGLIRSLNKLHPELIANAIERGAVDDRPLRESDLRGSWPDFAIWIRNAEDVVAELSRLSGRMENICQLLATVQSAALSYPRNPANGGSEPGHIVSIATTANKLADDVKSCGDKLQEQVERLKTLREIQLAIKEILIPRLERASKFILAKDTAAEMQHSLGYVARLYETDGRGIAGKLSARWEYIFGGALACLVWLIVVEPMLAAALQSSYIYLLALPFVVLALHYWTGLRDRKSHVDETTREEFKIALQDKLSGPNVLPTIYTEKGVRKVLFDSLVIEWTRGRLPASEPFPSKPLVLKPYGKPPKPPIQRGTLGFLYVFLLAVFPLIAWKLAHTFNSFGLGQEATLITHSNNRESCILARGSIFWRSPHYYHVTSKPSDTNTPPTTNGSGTPPTTQTSVTVVPLARVSEIIYGKNGLTDGKNRPADGLRNCTTLPDEVLRQQITVAPAKVDVPLVLSVPVPPVNVTNIFAGEQPKVASDKSIKAPEPAPGTPRRKAIILPFFSEPVWHHAGENKKYSLAEAYVTGFQSIAPARGAPAIASIASALKSCGNINEIVKDVMGFASDQPFTPPEEGLTSDDLNHQVAEGRRHYVKQALGLEAGIALQPSRNLQIKQITKRFNNFNEMKAERDRFFQAYLSAMWKGDEAFSRSVVVIVDEVMLNKCAASPPGAQITGGSQSAPK